MKLSPKPPYVLHEPRILSGQAVYAQPEGLQALIENAKHVLGVLSDWNSTGISALLSTPVDSLSSPTMRLLIHLYPACKTRSGDLTALYQYQAESQGKVQLRILLQNNWPPANPNCLLAVKVSPFPSVLSVGSVPNGGLAPLEHHRVNLVFEPDEGLVAEWSKWFDYIWANAVPLTESTAEVPFLVPAPGTLEGEAAWRDYLLSCEIATQAAKSWLGETVKVDTETGEVKVTDASGIEVTTPSVEAEIPKPNPVEIEIQRLYSLGRLVSPNRASKTQPLDAPLNPKDFGLKSWSQVGAVSQKLTMRISVFDEAMLKNLEKIRKKTRDLLGKYSYPLADGMRWIPVMAIALLEDAMKRYEDDGYDLICSILKNDAKSYIAKRRKKLRMDIDLVSQEVNPDKRLSEEEFERILLNIEKRLGRVMGDKLLPYVTYQSVGFSTSMQTSNSKPWEQALTLLLAIAEYPRKAQTDPYFMQGIRTPIEDLLAAMNVLDEDLFHNRERSASAPDLTAQLDLIKDIQSSDEEPKEKCEQLLHLIHGRWDEIQKIKCQDS